MLTSPYISASTANVFRIVFRCDIPAISSRQCYRFLHGSRYLAFAVELRELPHFTRVSTAIQFVSQVLPPSSENDCSKRHEFAVMSIHTLRTRIIRPLNGS